MALRNPNSIETRMIAAATDIINNNPSTNREDLRKITAAIKELTNSGVRLTTHNIERSLDRLPDCFPSAVRNQIQAALLNAARP